MAKWLFKEEPDCYPYDRLEADGETTWDAESSPVSEGVTRGGGSGRKVLRVQG